MLFRSYNKPMHILIAADHRGFEAKQALVADLRSRGVEVEDLGAEALNPEDDFTQYAMKVGQRISENPSDRGILICGSGEGMAILANKYKQVRAALVWKPEVAEMARLHNDANIIVFPADYMPIADMAAAATTFLDTNFSWEERHVRRLEQIAVIEGSTYVH